MDKLNIYDGLTMAEFFLLLDFWGIDDKKIYAKLGSEIIVDEFDEDDAEEKQKYEGYLKGVVKTLLEENKVDKIGLENFYFFKDELKNLGINFTCILDDKYPNLLKHIYDAPLILYYVGNIEKASNGVNIGVVGSRKPDDYGISATKKISREIAVNGMGVISGLALGIDSISHRECLENNGYTVAVLGSPLNNILPKTNRKVASDILKKGGCIISEYKPGSKVFPSNFSARNRIIAGISDGTVVVQAAKVSGSLITAKSALFNNRNVYAIPGNIFSFLSVGTNTLLKQGATPLTSIDDILFDMGELIDNNKKNEKDTCKTSLIYDKLNSDCKNLVMNLKDKPPMSIDEIYMNTGINIGVIMSSINQLLVEGVISQVGPDKFTLTL